MPSQMSLEERGRGRLNIHTRRRWYEDEAKIGVMWPEVNECWQPPEARRGKE